MHGARTWPSPVLFEEVLDDVGGLQHVLARIGVLHVGELALACLLHGLYTEQL